MILDSSAIVAIVLRQPGCESLLQMIIDTPAVAVGAPTLAESAIVLSARLGYDARGVLARFVQEGAIVVIPFSEAHFGLAVEAWLRFGKGRHSAALNFGDCLSYATAIIAGQPLLCIGDDFRRTDVALA